MADLRRRRSRRLIVLASFLIAYVLVLVPAPLWALPWRPPWVLLVLIYWCMALPHLVGLGVALGSGLLLDVLGSGALGVQAMAHTVVAWLVLLGHRRLRVLSPVHQALYVFGLLLVQRAIVFIVLGTAGHAPMAADFWLSALTGTVLWPPLLLLLREVRRSAQAR